MEYPKPCMTVRELQNMGYPRAYLVRVANSKRGKECVTRNGRRGRYLFDTAKFEKLKLQGCFL